MPITAKPEMLQPGEQPRRTERSASGLFTDANLDRLSHLLDDFIHIPGTPIRFGLDGIVGFLPGVGDLAGGVASSILIFAAWRRGLPRVVVLRMVLNVAIETVVGAVPYLGNLFDIGWRANRRNYYLLTNTLAHPVEQASGSWLFLAGVCLLLAVLIAIPMVVAGWIFLHLGHWLATSLAPS